MTGGLQVNVAGVGVLGPGLAGWPQAAAVLRQPAQWQRQPTAVPAPNRLPPTERRRAGVLVKASVTVADEALQASGLPAAELATVFASATGDASNCDALCQALALPERLVSPTRFTNSVHNAPAGYWHIAAASRRASTSLAAHDHSFAVALLEAAVQCVADQAPVLLVVCDQAMPEPMASLRPVPDTFAVALVLRPAGAGPQLHLQLQPTQPETPVADAGLEALRRDIPAARCLPLLRALAEPEASASLVLALQAGQSLGLRLAAA